MSQKRLKKPMSEDTKSIITVLLLLFAFPIGVILMWVWSKWALWLRLVITLVPIIFFASIVYSGYNERMNAWDSWEEKAGVVVACVQLGGTKEECYKKYDFTPGGPPK